MTQLIAVLNKGRSKSRVYCDGYTHVTVKDDKELHRWPCCCNNSKEFKPHPMPATLIGSSEGD